MYKLFLGFFLYFFFGIIFSIFFLNVEVYFFVNWFESLIKWCICWFFIFLLIWLVIWVVGVFVCLEYGNIWSFEKLCFLIKLYVFINFFFVLFGKLIIIFDVIVNLGRVFFRWFKCLLKNFIVYLWCMCFNIVFEFDWRGICKWCIIIFDWFSILIILFVIWFVLIDEIWMCFNFFIWDFKLWRSWVRL